jgi:hypothetical protein
VVETVDVHGASGEYFERKLCAGGYAERARKSLYGGREQAGPEIASGPPSQSGASNMRI